MNARLEALERRIQRIKEEIGTLGDLRPGSLSEQYNVCGSAGCRCKATPPVKHGPYHQVSFTFRRKSYTQFVRQEDLPVVQQQLRTYQRLRELVDLWIELAIEQSRLELQQRRSKALTRPRKTASETGDRRANGSLECVVTHSRRAG